MVDVTVSLLSIIVGSNTFIVTIECEKQEQRAGKEASGKCLMMARMCDAVPRTVDQEE